MLLIVAGAVVFLFCCSYNPGMVVLQVTPSCFFRFFNLDELVDFILPSFLWPSYSSAFVSMLSPGFHFAAFFADFDSEREASLIASPHFIFFVFLSNMECWLPAS